MSCHSAACRTCMAFSLLVLRPILFSLPVGQRLEAACSNARLALFAGHCRLSYAPAASGARLTSYFVASGCIGFPFQRCRAAAGHGHRYGDLAVARMLVQNPRRHRKGNCPEDYRPASIQPATQPPRARTPRNRGSIFSFIKEHVSKKAFLTARMTEHARVTTGKHRNATELQAALKVINDQLADANDLERPALELVAQKLTEELLEVERKEDSKLVQACDEEAKLSARKQPDSRGGLQQSSTSSKGPASGAGDSQENARLKQLPPQGLHGESGVEDKEWKEFFAKLPRVQIANGTQKYVLIKIAPEHNPEKHLKESLYLVRGNPSVEYHYQCALETIKELENMGAEGEVVGGGRIECRMKEKEVEIYGHSYQFGRADHAITAQLIKDAFGSDFQVSWGDYGY